MNLAKRMDWTAKQDEQLAEMEGIKAAVLLNKSPNSDLFGYSYFADFDDKSEVIFDCSGVKADMLETMGFNMWLRETEEDLVLDKEEQTVQWVTINFHDVCWLEIVAETREAAIKAMSFAIVRHAAD